ncbi:AtzH-like domain-containing protein [Acidicapsa acidisoli]
MNSNEIHPKSKVHGRQSHIWVRFSAGWRILSAHVTLFPTT